MPIYLPSGGTTDLDLGELDRDVPDPLVQPAGKAARCRSGTLASATGPGKINIGQPPEDTDKDWVALVERVKPGSPARSQSAGGRETRQFVHA